VHTLNLAPEQRGDRYQSGSIEGAKLERHRQLAAS
jgi:hypothetical protein